MAYQKIVAGNSNLEDLLFEIEMTRHSYNRFLADSSSLYSTRSHTNHTRDNAL